MGRLIYSAIASLDGYVADANGSFDWAAPDDEVHAFVNDLQRSVGTHLYGRRMYDVMSAWADPGIGAGSEVMADFAALWRAADKVVYSRTLHTPRTERTRMLPEFDPGAVREMKATLGRDLTVGGPELAGRALRAGLVDECQLFLAPVAVGGGIPVFPAGLHLPLRLLYERRFGGGTVYLRYATD